MQLLQLAQCQHCAEAPDHAYQAPSAGLERGVLSFHSDTTLFLSAGALSPLCFGNLPSAGP